MMPNLLQYPVACSAPCAPAASWSIATRSTRRANWNTRLKDSGAEAIVIVENFAHTLQQVLPH